MGGACQLYCGKIIPARKASHDGPSGNRYYFNNSSSAVADQWLDIDGVSYHFDANGALIEQKEASGTVTAVSSDTASTPSPTPAVGHRWWCRAGDPRRRCPRPASPGLTS